MKSITTSVALASMVAISTINGAYLGKNQFGVDRFSVDLDLPEEQRFVETSIFFKEPVNKVLKQYSNLIPPSLTFLVDQIGAQISEINPEYYNEI
jgi:N-acylethanolamine-hydrolysing acid amidase